ncbi:MAG: ABC-type transport auxiliary lipoprotein family protein [Asticcacaulis sp.]
MKFATLAMMAALGGCVSVGPKLKPVQMYRFGFTPDLLDKSNLTPVPGAGMPPVGIVFGTVTFPQDSSGDRITTIDGNEVSYVSQARWTAPAQELFNEAIGQGFARTAQSVRLESRGPSAAGYRLDIAVRQFESVYDSHNKPTVSIALDARIIRLEDKAVVGQRFIDADVPVGRNDMSLTADAYNKATTQAVAALIGFSEDTMAAQEGVQTPSVEQPSDGKQHVEGL